MKRPAHDRVDRKLKAELDLQNRAGGGDADESTELTEDALEADFHDDVLMDATESDIEIDVTLTDGESDNDADSAPDSVTSDLDFACHATDADPVPMQDMDPADSLPQHKRKCFHHWTITMATTVQALCRAHRPQLPRPKYISLLQRGTSVVWFAVEPAHPLKPSTVEGRITQLDGQGRVQYLHPGPGRKNVTDITAEVAAGSARFLLHTNVEHVKGPVGERPPMDVFDALLARNWHMAITRDGAEEACFGCRAPSPPCALCLSTVSTCCLGTEVLPDLDVLRSLQTRLGPDVDGACREVAPDAKQLLWELRGQRATVLCVFCLSWLGQRDA